MVFASLQRMVWWTFHTEVYFSKEKSAFLHYETDQKEQILT